MSAKKASGSKSGPREAKRKFETADDHVVAYSDVANVSSTSHEVILSLYRTIPGYPSETDAPAITTRVATVILSPAHALQIGKILVKHGEELLPKQPEDKKG